MRISTNENICQFALKKILLGSMLYQVCVHSSGGLFTEAASVFMAQYMELHKSETGRQNVLSKIELVICASTSSLCTIRKRS